MRRRRLIGLPAGLFALAMVAVLAFWTDEAARDDPPRGVATAPAGRTATPPPARTPRPRATLAVPAAVRRQAAAMSLGRRVAQLFLVGFEGNDATASIYAELRTRGWGGVLLGPDNVLSADQAAFLAGEAAAVSAVPPLVAPLDLFPPPPQLSTDSPGEVRRAAQARAAELRAHGLNLVFAPIADVGIQDGDGTFGDDPDRVARLVAAALRGWRAGGVIPAPGHFPGQGAASQDPLQGPSTIGLSQEELAVRDVIPFRAVLRQAPALVVSSAAFAGYDPVTPASLTPAITRDLLRSELGYTGVAISDDLAGVTAATGGTVGEAAVEAIRSGIDMVQVPDPSDRGAAYRAVLAAVRDRRIPAARLREAVLRVLALKRGL